MGRINKSINNLFFGVLEQIITVLLSFIVRTIFIKNLSIDLLGINGLFTNILSILSIAELGFGTAIIYGLYGPIARKEEKKIAALMNYYKKIYNALAIVIAFLGIVLLPFLDLFVNTDKQIENIEIYYIIFLIDSVCSYLLSSRIAIIQASQNTHLIKKYTIIFNILKSLLQIISLVLFRNYVLYLIIQVAMTFFMNVYGAKLARKLYPYAFEKIELDEEEKKSLKDNVKSMALYKLGGAIMNNTDNVLISVLTGTANVGLYSNYNMITSAITKFTSIFFNSISASVGDLNSGNDNEKKINMFYNIDFITNWLFGFCSVAFFVLSNNFIQLWLGMEYLFNTQTLIAITLNFYIIGVLNPILIYRDTTGLFKMTKFVFLITALINLVLSIVLGKIYGLFGILIASVIARLLTNFWFEPYMLLKRYFNTTVKKYFYSRLINIIISIGVIIVLNICFEYIKISNIFVEFSIQCFLTLIITNLSYYVLYRKHDEFKYYMNLINTIVKEKINAKNRNR